MSKLEIEGYKHVTIDVIVKILEGCIERRFLNELLASGELDHLKSLKRIQGSKTKKTYITSDEEFKLDVVEYMKNNKAYSRRIDKINSNSIDKIEDDDDFEYPSIADSQREKAYYEKELMKQKLLEMQKTLIKINEVEFIFEDFTNYIKKQLEILPKRMSDQINLKFGIDKNQVKLCLDEEIRVSVKNLQKDIEDYRNKFTEKEEIK